MTGLSLDRPPWKFAPGDRVVVKPDNTFDRVVERCVAMGERDPRPAMVWAGCYGHVLPCRHDAPGDPGREIGTTITSYAHTTGRVVYVKLIGRTDGAPLDAFILEETGWHFAPDELEHAD